MAIFNRRNTKKTNEKKTAEESGRREAEKKTPPAKKIKTQRKNQTKAAKDVKTQSQPVKKPKEQAKPQTKAVNKMQSKTQTKAVNKTQSKAQTNSVNKKQNKTQTKAVNKTQGKAQAKPNAGARKTTNKEIKPLRIIPIGGLNEIGKNMTIFEYGNDIMILDCGMSFPNDEMLGIDIVLPDFTYLLQNRKKLKGLVLTHGHEDHIGAIPYLLKEIPELPVYGSRLTLGLVKNKLDEHGIKGKLNNIKPGDRIKVGCFKVEAIRTTHSIADSLCFSIDTPAGRVFHTGDFKVDYTPVDGEPIDFARLAEIGKEGVMLLMCDSTNVVKPGFSPSERTIEGTLARYFRQAKGRIIIATFSSNVHRVQKIIDNAVALGRKVAISGRSMENVMKIASELGYLKIPKNAIVDLAEASKIPDKNLLIITTGSQGEPMSALSRMADARHKNVQIKKGDMVILSSTPIPGNEKSVSNIVNKLFELGANVIYSGVADIHVSGHACQEELKLIHSLIKPTYFMPVHGEYRHLMQHAMLAELLGMDSSNIAILENGKVLNVGPGCFKVTDEDIPAHAVLMDGLGTGDVGDVVLNDRKLLSEAGLIIVTAAVDSENRRLISGPEIVSRGFIYVKENEDMMARLKKIAEKSINAHLNDKNIDWSSLKAAVRSDIRSSVFKSTNRSPIILPIFLEV